MKRETDYTQLLKVLHKKTPDRPVLFELFLNWRLYQSHGKPYAPVKEDGWDIARMTAHAYKNTGFDYVTLMGTDFGFPQQKREHKNTISLNDGACITDRESYERYEWPDPAKCDYSRLEKLDLPDGLKIVTFSPGGVLENAIGIVGYDNLCVMLYDDPQLAKQIFDDVGSRILAYNESVSQYDNVCAMIANDDWGFKTQTMLSPEDMRKYVFPWHKKIVAAGHKAGKPVILHSCGYAGDVMEDIIEDMKYDAKHSFEDAISPIEDEYEQYKGRIALLGGIDVHYLVTRRPDEITARSKAMLERSSLTGGYALGSGNSIPEYITDEKFFAMTAAALN
ncbi:MAG: hypothetical protein FWE82_07960 [Defluviitaleaceae bacterium]|nr:hypothetical protein [Defluviitaleaceae bacterium]